MRASSVRGLVLGTPAMDESRRFYAELWGLEQVGHDERRAYFAGGGADHWALGLEQSDTRRLALLRLGVDTPADVDRFADQLEGGGIALATVPGPLAAPGDYHGFTFRDTAGRLIEISAPAAPRLETGRDPSGISHIVLNSADVRGCVDFYCRHLGFEISDWYEGDHLIFLRCNTAHHCIAFSKSDRNTLNHVAYEMRDLEAVISNSERVSQALGQRPIWGPGRHGPGGNVFAYFKDPGGFVCEYTAELIQIRPDDDWVAQPWTPGPGVANVWQTGGPSPEAAALMSGAGQP